MSQHGGRSSPTGGVSPPGSSTNCPRETASASLAARTSGASQDFLRRIATCGLGSANLASPSQLSWMRERCLGSSSAVRLLWQHAHTQPLKERKPLNPCLGGWFIFAFPMGKTHHCTVVIPAETSSCIEHAWPLPGHLTCSPEGALLTLHLFPKGEIGCINRFSPFAQVLGARLARSQGGIQLCFSTQQFRCV